MKRLICAECGGDIVGRPGNAKYCLACVREAEKRRKRGSKQEGKRRPAAVGFPSAGEIVLAARREKMTYGEYVAKYGL